MNKMRIFLRQQMMIFLCFVNEHPWVDKTCIVLYPPEIGGIDHEEGRKCQRCDREEIFDPVRKGWYTLKDFNKTWLTTAKLQDKVKR